MYAYIFCRFCTIIYLFWDCYANLWPTATIFKQTKFKPSLDMKFADRNNYAR